MTPVELQLLQAFTTGALALFVIIVTAALVRMSWRLLAFLRTGTPVPVLLRRDMVLFGTFAAYFGLVLVFRLRGAVLTQNPFWVIPSTTAILAAMGYWVWVEYHLDDPDK